jgi:hypothetical protein
MSNPSPPREVITGVACTLLATIATGLLVFGHALLGAAIIARGIPLGIAAITRGLVRLKKERSE